jgi:hypothetical protein
MDDGSGGYWMIMTVLGVIALGVALAYGIMRNRSVTRGQKEAGERGAERVYAEENRDQVT